MRLRHILPLVALALGATARPSSLHPGAEADVAALAGHNNVAARDSPDPHLETRTVLPRGVGSLGASAFAGAGAPSGAITALQRLLGARGHSVAVDGLWGPETAGAVAAFQRGAGLSADSIPGPNTLGALVDQVAQGSSGGIVSAAQTLLTTHGAAIDTDGQFGPATRAAVVAFQTSAGLEADGIVGVNTWTKLFTGGNGGGTAPPPPPPSLPPVPVPSDPVLPVPDPVARGQASKLAAWEVTMLLKNARYAAAGYCAAAKTWSCKYCDGGAPIDKIYKTGGNDKDTLRWYVGSNSGGTIVVSVSGSNGDGPWDDNTKIRQVTPEDGGRYLPGAKAAGVLLHTGFHGAFLTMIPDINVAVGAAQLAGNKRIFVAGHSQGGAVGTMVAVSLQKLYPGMVVHGTFYGTPRAGNTAWADYVDVTFGDRAPHVINYNDIVPSLLLRKVSMGLLGKFDYTHPGNEVWITGDGQWVRCKGRENPFCAASIPFRELGWGTHNGPYGVVQMAEC